MKIKIADLAGTGSGNKKIKTRGNRHRSYNRRRSFLSRVSMLTAPFCFAISACLPVCLSVHLSVYLSVRLPVTLRYCI